MGSHPALIAAMNIIDLFLLLVLAASALFALYRGSVASLLGLAACLLSFVFAFAMGPRLAAALGRNQGVTTLLTTYTDASSLVGDHSLATTAVSGMSASTLEAVLKSVSLPESIEGILRQNLAGALFESAGMRTVNDYVSATIVSVMLETGSFVLCYFACCLALHMLISLLAHVYELPVLRHFDGALAALFGLLRGALLLYVLFLLLPLVRAMIPQTIALDPLNASALAPVFSSDGFFTRVISGF